MTTVFKRYSLLLLPAFYSFIKCKIFSLKNASLFNGQKKITSIFSWIPFTAGLSFSSSSICSPGEGAGYQEHHAERLLFQPEQPRVPGGRENLTLIFMLKINNAFLTRSAPKSRCILEKSASKNLQMLLWQQEQTVGIHLVTCAVLQRFVSQ